MKDQHRERGFITYVRVENFRGEGGEPNTVNVGVEFGAVNVGVEFGAGGSTQGFGGLMLDPKHQKDFVDQLKYTFDVKTQKALEGQECFALRPFGTWGDNIVGLESVKTGRKFTMRAFRISQGFSDKTVYQEELERIRNDIAFHERRITEQKTRLTTLKDSYIEW